jgi:hypothetical protein
MLSFVKEAADPGIDRNDAVSTPHEAPQVCLTTHQRYRDRVSLGSSGRGCFRYAAMLQEAPTCGSQ